MSHETAPRNAPTPAGGDEETIESISEHIQRHVGPIETVFHEIYSETVHVDVHWVKPDSHRPFHTLITSGMCDLAMNAPPGTENQQYAELVALLPPHWRLSKPDLQNEVWYWPIRWLKILARFPHEYNTWLWMKHSVPCGDPPEPLAPNTKLCCLCLWTPFSLPEDFQTLTIGEREVHFFSLIPLYAEEMNRKLQHGVESLIPRFAKHGIDDIIRVDRPNVCRRRFRIF